MTHVLTLFSMGLFGAAHGMMEDEGGARRLPHPSNLSHIFYNDETWYRYTFSKEVPKLYESRDTPCEFC